MNPGLTLLVWLTAHCSCPQAHDSSQGGLEASGDDLWGSANTSLLHGFWCQPASQLSRDQLSTLIQGMATQQVPLRAWQVSGCGRWELARVSRARVLRERAHLPETGGEEGRARQRTRVSGHPRTGMGRDTRPASRAPETRLLGRP